VLIITFTSSLIWVLALIKRLREKRGLTVENIFTKPLFQPTKKHNRKQLKLKSLSSLSTSLKALLKINIVITALPPTLIGLYYYTYSNLSLGMDVNEGWLPTDTATTIVDCVQLFIAIILGVTFLRWIYRANKNLHLLSSEQMDFTPGWSIGWYFVPIAHLFKPYQAMKEIWNVAHRGKSSIHTILVWWWFLWITSMISDRMVMKLAVRAYEAAGYTALTVAHLFSDGIDVALNVVALMLVTSITQAYERNFVEPIRIETT